MRYLYIGDDLEDVNGCLVIDLWRMKEDIKRFFRWLLRRKPAPTTQSFQNAFVTVTREQAEDIERVLVSGQMYDMGIISYEELLRVTDVGVRNVDSPSPEAHESTIKG